MRRLLKFAVIAAIVIVILALGGARNEGEYLSDQIAEAAQQLAVSNDDALTVYYEPRSGVDQSYWVAVGAGPRCPDRNCALQQDSWLTVHTEGRDSGISYSYQRFVAVPRPLKISKRGAPVEIVLRKIGDEVQLVDLR